MKLFLTAILLASTYTAFSVADVSKTSDNVYTASKNIAADKLAKAGKDVNDNVTILTTGCDHATTKGESAIILTGPNGTTILFSNGGTCKVSRLI